MSSGQGTGWRAPVQVRRWVSAAAWSPRPGSGHRQQGWCHSWAQEPVERVEERSDAGELGGVRNKPPPSLRHRGQRQHRPIWRRPGRGHPYRRFQWDPTCGGVFVHYWPWLLPTPGRLTGRTRALNGDDHWTIIDLMARHVEQRCRRRMALHRDRDRSQRHARQATAPATPASGRTRALTVRRRALR